jgi:hypothetical protein
MPKERAKIVWEPVKMENILRFTHAVYVGEDAASDMYNVVSSYSTALGERLVPSGQKVRIIVELLEEDGDTK